ncbi:MAG: hypothetical protein P4L46_01245 [Fimbriimonas sp.]|nr:hypothetical protein [Fimbriimonas sp.]
MKRIWIFGLACLGVAIIVGVLWMQRASSSDRADLERELAIASKEGLPVTWQEYASTIKPAKPTENAAPIYRKIGPLVNSKIDLSTVLADVNLRPSASTRKVVESTLRTEHRTVDLIDQAAAKPRCWFDRDWSKGLAVLMPEYARIKGGIRLVLLRGAMKASEGEDVAAVQDAREVIAVARHVGEEDTAIAALVQLSIYALATHQLAIWAYEHPSNPVYRKALIECATTWPKTDLHRIHRSDMIEIREVLRLSTTKEGRRELGLHEEDVPFTERFIPIVVSRPKADIVIAREMRRIWEAYGEAPSERIRKADESWQRMLPALAAYPVGADIYLKLSDQDETGHSSAMFDLLQESRRLSYLAFARALGGQRIPKAVKLDDLKSPFTSHPLEYAFDGRQVTITVDCHDPKIDVRPLKVPSDSELHPNRFPGR